MAFAHHAWLALVPLHLVGLQEEELRDYFRDLVDFVRTRAGEQVVW